MHDIICNKYQQSHKKGISMHLKQFLRFICFLSVFNVICIITSHNNQNLSIDQKPGSLTPTKGSPQLIPCNQGQPSSFGAQLSSITIQTADSTSTSTSTKSPTHTYDAFSKTLKRLPLQNDSTPTDSTQRPPTRRPTEHPSTTKPA